MSQGRGVEDQQVEGSTRRPAEGVSDLKGMGLWRYAVQSKRLSRVFDCVWRDVDGDDPGSAARGGRY